jgi:hypothetical protein
LLTGCAHARREPRKDLTQARNGGGSASLAVYRQRAERPAAAALVFAPPIAATGPQPDLSRDDRQPSAFVGYPEGVVEFFSVRWDDRQVGGDWGGGFGFRSGSGGSGFGDRYERRAVSEKVGALYR